MKAICTDCGYKFTVEEQDYSYVPEECPSCGKPIIDIHPTPTSEEMAAQVEE